MYVASYWELIFQLVIRFKWAVLHFFLQSQALEHPDLTFSSGGMVLRGKIFRAILFMQLTVTPLPSPVAISIILVLSCAQYMFYFFSSSDNCISVLMAAWRSFFAKKPAAKMLLLWRPGAD
jgi:hypothetical protein